MCSGSRNAGAVIFAVSLNAEAATMQLSTLLFLAAVLHCTQRTGTFLHWYWNKSSNAMTDTEDMVDDKIHQWNTENNSRFPENEKIKKKLEKACADLGYLSIESHDDNNDGLAYMMRIQKQITHIHENIEWRTKHIVARNVEDAARYESNLEKLRKINETMHTIWNGIEFMLSDVEQKLGWINDDVNNRSEQLNRVYQTAQHIFYLLGAVVVAAFLQAPFITRALIIIIVPLNLMAFLKHGNMEDCLGFGSTTALICFMTAVHFLMGEENGISHEGAYRQFKIETFLTATKSQMYEFLTATNVVIKKLFEVLIQIMSNIKGSIIKNSQVAATWFRQHNLIYGTKTSNFGTKQLSIHDLSLKPANVAIGPVTKSIDNVTYKIEHPIQNATASKPINIESSNGTFPRTARSKLIAIKGVIFPDNYLTNICKEPTLEANGHQTKFIDTAKEPRDSNETETRLTKEYIDAIDTMTKKTIDELMANQSSMLKNKSKHTNQFGTIQEKSYVTPKQSTELSSVQQSMCPDPSITEARKNLAMDILSMPEDKAKHINELEMAKEPSNVMPKKLTKPSLTEQDFCSEPPFGETGEKLTAGYPSAPEDKANNTNEVRTAQEKSNIMTKKSSDSSSPEPDASSDVPLEGARKNPIRDINNIKTSHAKFDVMPKKSTDLSSNDRVTCSNTLVKGNSSAQERLAGKDTKAHSNSVPADTKPFTAVTEKADPNVTNSTPVRPVGRIEPNLNPSGRTVVPPNITGPNENANASNRNLSPSRSSPATAPAYSQHHQHQRNDSASSTDSNDHIQSHTEARRSEINERIGSNSYQSQLYDDLESIFDLNCYTRISPKSCSSRSVAISPISDLCGAMTQKGTPCRNKPSYGGPRCWRHCGATVSMPSPARSSSSGYDSLCSISNLCGAMTQKGTPCRNKPSYGGPRCWRHCGATVSMPSPARSSSSGYDSLCSISNLCGAMTQKGTPCRNKPSYGGPRCWRHCGATVSMPSPARSSSSGYDSFCGATVSMLSPARSSSSGYDSFCSSSGLCGAMTQKGTPCRNKPSYGGSRCWRH